MKEYLKCVGFTILVTCFIATIYLSIAYFGEAFYANVFEEIYHYSMDSSEKIEVLVDTGKNMEDSFVEAEARIQEQKEMFGEDYPALGIFLNRLLYVSCGEVAYVNIFAILIGLVYGTIFYIFAIQKAKGKKLIIELIIALVVIMALIQGCITIYNFVLNRCVSDAINSNIKIDTQLNIIVPYLMLFIIIVLMVGVGNRIYQGIMTKKLNKELEKQ